MITLSSIESVMILCISIFRLRYSPRDLAIVSEILIVARATQRRNRSSSSRVCWLLRRRHYGLGQTLSINLYRNFVVAVLIFLSLSGVWPIGFKLGNRCPPAESKRPHCLRLLLMSTPGLHFATVVSLQPNRGDPRAASSGSFLNF